MVMNVPHIETGKLSASTLVLADLLEKVAPRNIGTGPFVIGGTKVRPRLSASFRRDEAGRVGRLRNSQEGNQ